MHRLSITCLLALTLASPAHAGAPAGRTGPGDGAWAAYAPDTIVVKLGSGRVWARTRAPARRAGVARTVAVLPGAGARLVRVNGDPAAVAGRLARVPGVRWAEPNWILHATTTRGAPSGSIPDDPRFGELYGLAAIGAPAAWKAAGLGAFPAAGGVPVGIVDTGVDPAHEDLAGKVRACATAAHGRVTESPCTDDNGHGTHVGGTIGAVADNGLGVAGVAFASPLIVCRALSGADGSGTTADVAACLRWTHEAGARVISMSLGGPWSRTLAAAARSAWAAGGRRGSVLVAAAGNDGDASIEYPAGLAEVVSVGAVGPDDALAPFSNRNSDLELVAPGIDVLSTRAGGGYLRLSGTSMAGPHVAGAAALLWGIHPRSKAATIRAMLDAAVSDLGPAGRDDRFGYGRLDLGDVDWRP